MDDPMERILVQEAAVDALGMLNSMGAANTGFGARAVTKMIRSGNRLIRVHVSLVDDPPAGSLEGEG